MILACCAVLPPVVLLHGLFSTAASMEKLEKRVKAYFREREVYNAEVLLGSASTVFGDMEYYVYQFAKQIKQNVAAQQIDLVGHSLGGHIVRAYVQKYAGKDGFPGVRNLISIAGVNSGIFCVKNCYGIPSGLLTQEVLGNAFVQHNIIPANLYVNPKISKAFGFFETLQKIPITGVEKYVCFYSDNDGILAPPQTAGYRFYDKNLKVTEFLDGTDYTNNNFGIRDLYQQGHLTIIQLNQFTHTQFIGEKVDEFFEIMKQYIM